MARFGGIVAAEPDPASVGGHDVVIVALGDGPGIDFLQVCGTVGGDLVQAAAFVDDQPFAVRRPVGRLDQIGEFLYDLVRAGLDIEDLQITVRVSGVLCVCCCSHGEEEKEGESDAHKDLDLWLLFGQGLAGRHSILCKYKERLLYMQTKKKYICLVKP